LNKGDDVLPICLFVALSVNNSHGFEQILITFCSVIIRYDTIDDLHWKTDRQAASLI